MGKFGWSYPPGCSGTPYDDEGPCECCGSSIDHCECPECPACGEIGNPSCYRDVMTQDGDVRGPHMFYTMDQIHGQALLENYYRDDREADKAYAKSILEDRGMS